MTQPPSSSLEDHPAPSGLMLAVAWLFVGLPLAWGVMQTIIKSMALFH